MKEEVGEGVRAALPPSLSVRPASSSMHSYAFHSYPPSGHSSLGSSCTVSSLSSLPTLFHHRHLFSALLLLLLLSLHLSSCPVHADFTVYYYRGAPAIYTNANIKTGETVTWVWYDDLPHSVEGTGSAAGMFKGKGGGAYAVQQKGFAYSFKFTRPGTFPYQCHVHAAFLFGTITVETAISIGGAVLPWFMGVTYSAASAVIQQGDRVTWVWQDDLPHSLLADDGDLSVFGRGRGANMNLVAWQGFNLSRRFDKPGYFLYHCSNHGALMRGNITVLSKDGRKNDRVGGCGSHIVGWEWGGVGSASIWCLPSSTLPPRHWAAH